MSEVVVEAVSEVVGEVVGQVPARYLLSRVGFFIQNYGVSPQQMLAGTQYLPADLEGALMQPGASISVQDDLAVYRNAQRLAQQPDAGFLLGQALRPGDYGLLGHALISCATVGDAFALLNDIVQLDGPFLETRYAIEQEEVIIEAHPMLDIGGLLPFVTEELLGVWRYSELPVPGLIKHLNLLEVAHPEPAHSETYRRLFDVPIRFSAPRTAAHLPLSILTQPIRFGDPEVAAILQQRIESLLTHMQPGQAEVDSLRQALMNIPIRYWSAERLAERLDCTLTELRRKLSNNSSSYKELKLDVRLAMAKQYLADPALSIAQIAKLLEYSTPSNFIRFFKTNDGRTPLAYRSRSATSSQI